MNFSVKSSIFLSFSINVSWLVEEDVILRCILSDVLVFPSLLLKTTRSHLSLEGRLVEAGFYDDCINIQKLYRNCMKNGSTDEEI